MVFDIHSRRLLKGIISFTLLVIVFAALRAQLSSATSFSGYISQGDLRFHYIEVPYPSTVEISVYWGSVDDDIDIYLYDPYGKKVGESCQYWGWTNYERIRLKVDTTGTYELRVYCYGLSTALSISYWGEYTVTPIKYTITFDASPRVASITIDGTTYIELPKSFDWIASSSHSFSVDSIVPSQAGLQYVFTHWGDGDTSASRTITVSGPANYVAYYKTQYYLNVESDHGDPQGQGWYDAGSTARFSVTSPVSAGFGIKHVFDHWEGDASANTPSAEITMWAAHTVRAVWRTDYTELYSVIGAIGIVGLVGAFVGVKILRGRKGPPKPPQEAPAPPVEKPVVKPVKPRVTPSEIDRIVYDYILQHKGVVSISQAARDLDITIKRLNASIKRLKKQRRIKSAHKVKGKT